jgi:hypothetical protein
MVGLAEMFGEKEEFTAASSWSDAMTVTAPYPACKYSAYRVLFAPIQHMDIRWVCGAFL